MGADEPAARRARPGRAAASRAVRDERLPAEARVDRHHEHEVDVGGDVFERRRRRRRVEHDARLGAELLDVRDRAVQVRHGLDVHRDHAGAGGDEVFDVAIGLLDHQVHVERPRGDALDRAHDRRADRDVRDEVAVHHVDVNEVGAAALGGRDVAAERGEVGGENRGRDQHVGGATRSSAHLERDRVGGRHLEAAGGCCRTTVPGGMPGYGLRADDA